MNTYQSLQCLRDKGFLSQDRFEATSIAAYSLPSEKNILFQFLVALTKSKEVPVNIILSAPDGVYAGAEAIATGGTPIVYISGQYAPITAEVGEIITPYKFVINGMEVGDWFESPSVFPDHEEGDIIQVRDAVNNLSNGLIGSGSYDEDNKIWIADVELADNAGLEGFVKSAMNEFVVGCKSDGNWEKLDRISVPIVARTLAGFAVAAKGAQTFVGFVESDVDRFNGLSGGAGKFVNLLRTNSDDPQDDQSFGVWVAEVGTGSGSYFGSGGSGDGRSSFSYGSGNLAVRSRQNTAFSMVGFAGAVGFLGVSRSVSTGYLVRVNGATQLRAQVSQTPNNVDQLVFATGPASSPTLYTNGKLKAWWAGRAINQEALEFRLLTLFERLSGLTPTGVTTNLELRSVIPESLSGQLHNLFYGQSLSIGAEGTPIASTFQPYDNQTFRGGPRSFNTELDELIPLIENAVNPAPDGLSNRGETPVSGAMNGIVRLMESEDGITQRVFRLIGSTCGKGGTAITGLNKESAWYSNYFLTHLQAGIDLASSKVFSIPWIHGGTDAADGVDFLTYKTRFEQLVNDMVADVKSRTGQSFDPVIMSCQTSSSSRSNPDIVLAQWSLAQEDPRVLTVCPCYFFDFRPDGLHLSADSYLRLGYYFAKAWKRYFIDKLQWRPLGPTGAAASGTTITVEFAVPVQPLVIDHLLGMLTGEGFRVLDDTGDLEISAVSVTGPAMLEIEVNRPLGSNPKLRYGIDYARADNSISNGGAGCLRDSDATTVFGKALPNWCVQFEISILS